VQPITTQPAHPAKLCANNKAFSLHAGVQCAAEDRQGIEQLARYITRPRKKGGGKAPTNSLSTKPIKV
jgi:hypothetical protein